MSWCRPRSAIWSTVGPNRVMSLRFAPSAAQPTAMPAASVAIEVFQPDLRLSTGLLPVPGPPQGALWIDPSMHTSASCRPMMRSQAASASAAIWSNTPAATHSSRRDRSVVSDTSLPSRISTDCHEQPSTSRQTMPCKHSRSHTRGR